MNRRLAQFPVPSACATMVAAIAATLALQSCGDGTPTQVAKAPAPNAPAAPASPSAPAAPASPSDSPVPAPDAPSAPAAPAAAAASGLPEGLLLARKPWGAAGVATARVGAQPGTPIAMIGRIGGTRSPIVTNRAVFTIVDPSLRCCLETGEEDHCPKPWDYCCEDRAKLAAAMATIEVTDASGKPLQLSLEQEGTLKPLTLVAVQGTLDPSGGPGTLVVRATGIYVMPDDPLAERIRAFRAK